MRLLLGVLLISACAGVATRSHARHMLTGPRKVTVYGPEEDVRRLEDHLRSRGIAVALALPHADEVTATTRYVLKVEGYCGTFMVEPTLHVDGYDSETHERIFVSERLSREDCPENFWRDVAKALDGYWQVARPPELDDPALHRKLE